MADDAGSDLGVLWVDALDQYQEETGIDMRGLPEKSWSLTRIVMDQQAKLNAFVDYRHDGGKLDKVRHFISDNADIIQKVADNVVESAKAAFPPSTAILTAFTHVMTASKHVSQDYDMIESFFELMNTFMQRMSLLEGKLPREAAYQKPLVKVFCSMLGLCAIARSYSVKWGRLTKWMKAMIEGKDSKLSAAYDGLLASMTELESTTIIRTLRAVMETRDDVKATHSTLEQTSAMVAKIYTRSQQVLDVSLDTNAGVREVLSVAMENREGTHETISILRRQEVRIMQQLVTAQREKDPDEVRQHDTGARKSRAVETVKRNFGSFFDDGVRMRLADLAASLIPGTFEWVEREEGYCGIVDRSVRLLWVTGGTGMGKSSLGYSVFRRLRDALRFDKQASVAGFFSDRLGKTLQLSDMLYWCAQQIAEQDATYCDEIRRVKPWLEFESDKLPPGKRTWEAMYEAKFPKLSDRRLVLVLDSVDQLEDDTKSREVLFQCISDAVKSDLSIQFILVCSPSADVEALCQDAGASRLDLAAPAMAKDFKVITRARIQQFTQLRKLRTKVRQKIQRRLSAKADCFLYIEHMLRFLNSLGRERRVLKALDHLPSSTPEIYKFLYEECQKNRSDKELALLRKLLTWLVYAQQRISIGAAKCLLRIIAPDIPVTIEEELEGSLSQLLRVSASEFGRSIGDSSDSSDCSDQDIAEDGDDSTSLGVDEAYDVEDIFPETSLDFQEPHMRAYFRSAILAEAGDATSARVAMFELMNSVLMCERASEANDFGMEELLSEGSRWRRHLFDIEVAGTTDEQAAVVIEGLCGVCSNAHHALRQIEQTVEPLLGSTETDTEEALHALHTWAERGSHLPADTLSDMAVDWVRKTLEEPGHILIRLAQGHVSNWFEADNDYAAFSSFRLAHDALATAHRRNLPELREIPSLRDCFKRDFPSSPRDFRAKAEAFDAVADAFPHISKSVRRHYCLAMALVCHGHVLEALERAKMGLPLAEDDQMRFDLYFLISQTIIFRLRSLEMGIVVPETMPLAEETDRALRQALQASEDGIICGSRLPTTGAARLDSLYSEPPPLVQLFFLKAHALFRLGAYGEAMETVVVASRLPDFKLGILETDTFIQDFATARRWDLIMQLPALSSEAHRSQFIGFCSDKTHTLMQRAAKETGREREMDARYRSAIRYIDANYNSSMQGSACRLQLARFVFGVLGDGAGAKLLLSKVKLDEPLVGLDSQRASWLLAVVLLDEFRGPGLRAKQAALDEMKQLRERVAESFAGMMFEPEMSQLAVPVALMLRKLGPAVEFQATADATFRKCIETLQDDKQSNDASSFRMLAKTLSLLPGLEREAEIAASCQLYIIDMNVYAQEEKARLSLSDGGSSPDDSDGEGTLENDAADVAAEVPTKGIASDIVAGGSVSPGQQGGMEKTGPDAPSAGPTGGWKAVDGEAEYDMAPDGHPQCAWCEKRFDSWEQGPLYMCYYCPEMDLCEGCFRDKLATENGTAAEPHWRVVCPKGHKNIRAPVKSWKGVKDGVIFFQDGFEIKFATWLRELEVKWDTAWEVFLSE